MSSRTPRGLIPDFAIGRMPEPIQEAQRTAGGEALARSRDRVREAREAAERAPELDGEALAEAARSGAKPPAPTESLRRQEYEAAREAARVLAEDHDAAVKRLHRTVAEHAPEALAAENKELASLRIEAEPMLAELVEVFERIDATARVAVGVAEADEFTENDRRGKRYSRLGKLSFTSPRAVRPDLSLHELIPKLRAALDANTAPIPETAGQIQKREQREADERPRMPRSMAGGVYVGG